MGDNYLRVFTPYAIAGRTLTKTGSQVSEDWRFQVEHLFREIGVLPGETSQKWVITAKPMEPLFIPPTLFGYASFRLIPGIHITLNPFNPGLLAHKVPEPLSLAETLEEYLRRIVALYLELAKQEEANALRISLNHVGPLSGPVQQVDTMILKPNSPEEWETQISQWLKPLKEMDILKDKHYHWIVPKRSETVLRAQTRFGKERVVNLAILSISSGLEELSS